MALRSNSELARGTFVMEVLANRLLCDEHYLLRLHLAGGGFPATQPGQFVQLQCRDVSDRGGLRTVDWDDSGWLKLTGAELKGAEPLLRRPMSLAGRCDTDEGVELEIIYRVVGAGTRWLSAVGTGETLGVLGPLGNAFAIRGNAKPLAALVGGGVGIPPMIYLAAALRAVGSKKTVAFCGGRSANLLPLGFVPGANVSADGRPTSSIADFARYGAASVVTTDDASLGVRGFVTDALEKWIDRQADAAERLVVYVCGPERMMRKTGEMCIARGVECQLLLERYMACGMGTCQSCVCKIRADNPQGWEYKLCCSDGPVFGAGEVVWEGPLR